MISKRQTLTGIVPIVALAALAACVSAPPPVLVATTTAPPAAPVPIDGAYGGIMQLVRGDPMSCGDQVQFSLRVVNHGFSFRLAQPRAEWKPFIVFTARIADDGSFNARVGPDYMRGRISGGNMTGEISGDTCGFVINADRGGI